MLALQLLGPVVLRRDGVALALGVKKTVALLMLLACGGAAPRSRVVALLWPALDEAAGRRNLRRELARLREAGAPDVLHADGELLRLAVPQACDVHAFEDAIRQGRPDEALALWRGDPADGLALDDAGAFDDWLALERERLRQLRRRALRASAEAHEARGDAESALAHIAALLADDPVQEQNHRDAMRLLAACGRREDALAQYRRCCELLRADLGLAPMAETEALAASLRGAALVLPVPPRAAAAAIAAPRLLPTQLPFVGREREVAWLEARWREGGAVLVVGEAGVGKTRLALDLAATLGPCAVVRCRPGDAELPYASFARALRTLVGVRPDRAALAGAGLAAWAIEELARLLPELGAPPAPLRSAEERARFFEACAQGWQALAAGDFDVVLLDDWHLADPSSTSLLIHVAQQRREGGAGGAREWLLLRPELDPAAMQRLRAGLQADLLTLPPLDDAAVLSMLQQLSGAPRPERFAARLLQATAGNPFFLSETLRHLTELQILQSGPDGIWRTPFDEATDDYRELPVPASVRDAVLARVQRLGAGCQRVLEAAALAGDAFSPALLAPACALSELDVVLAIERALDASLLREHESAGYAFAHDLVQQSLESSLSAERRRLVHRRLALGAEAAGAAPAWIARHHELSGERRRAVPLRLAAGDAAQRLNVLAEAIAQWRKALQDEPTPEQSHALRARLMRALLLRDEREASLAEAAALRALAGSGQLGPAERLEAMLDVAGVLARADRSAEALDLLESLPGALSDSARVTRSLVRVDALRELGRVDEALATANEALAMTALRGPDRARLLDSMQMAEHLAGRQRVALGYAEAGLKLCRELGDDVGIARGLTRHGVALIELGELDAAECELIEAAEHCGRLGLVGMQRAALYNLCCLYSSQDRPHRVLEVADRIWNVVPPMQHSELRVMVRLAFVDAHVALGDFGAAWRQAEPAVDDALAVGEPLALAAVGLTCLELLAMIGERACGQRLLAALHDDALRQMPQLASQLRVAQAHFELIGGSIGAARQALASQGDPAQIANAMVRDRHAVVSAELALAEGRPAQARLPADDAPGMNDELRMRALALRVAAAQREGHLSAALAGQARQALSAPSPHTLSALALARALAAVPMPAGAADVVARVAASLQAHPRQQQAFLGRYG